MENFPPHTIMQLDLCVLLQKTSMLWPYAEPLVCRLMHKNNISYLTSVIVACNTQQQTQNEIQLF